MATPPTEPTSTPTAPEGPVLTVLTKRIRTLRKKLTRISQIELALSQNKPLNPEQLDLLRSKPSVLSLIDELDKLRTPLSLALDHQLSQTPTPTEPHPEPQPETDSSERAVKDLVKLLYIGTLFDVKKQTEFTSIMLTRTHERGCCLTYDYVTDDDAELLGERDLDLIASLQGLMIARPVDSDLSHMNALDSCFRHAKLWLENSDERIHENTDVTYAALREKLNKILSSDYFTAMPQMKGPGEVAAAGNFGLFGVPPQESMANVEVPIQEVEGSPEQQQQETEENAASYEAYETAELQAVNTEEFHKGELEPENTPEVVSVQTDQEQFQDAEGDHGYRNADFKDQQYVHRRGSRGGRGGGRRGYPNGRGGRGTGRGNGSYQNGGRNQYYDNYYPRNNNYYPRRGGRGGSAAGGGGYYNGSSGAQGDHTQENTGVAS